MGEAMLEGAICHAQASEGHARYTRYMAGFWDGFIWWCAVETRSLAKCTMFSFTSFPPLSALQTPFNGLPLGNLRVFAVRL